VDESLSEKKLRLAREAREDAAQEVDVVRDKAQETIDKYKEAAERAAQAEKAVEIANAVQEERWKMAAEFESMKPEPKSSFVSQAIAAVATMASYASAVALTITTTAPAAVAAAAPVVATGSLFTELGVVVAPVAAAGIGIAAAPALIVAGLSVACGTALYYILGS
jgi:hypothetical protein